MNILYIPHDSELIGGANLSLLGIIDEIKKKKDINIVVLLPNKKGALVNELKCRNIKTYIYNYSRSDYIVNDNTSLFIEKIKKLKTYLGEIHDKLFLFKVKKILDKEKIDIVHTNSSVVKIGGYVYKKYKIPHLWHIREFGKEDYNMKFIGGEENHMKFISNNSSKIIFISKSLQDKYKKTIDVSNTEIVYNGIDIDKEQKEIKKNNGKFNILIAANIITGKNQLEAVKAVNVLRSKGYKDIVLNIAGKVMDSEYYENILKYIKENNMEDYIILRGNLSKKELKDLRSEVKVELVCSLKEAFGRVTIEAMSNRLTVIGSNTGGTSELIKNGYNGYLYELGNENDLASKIEYLYENKEELVKIGKNGYEFTVKNFTRKRNAEDIYTLYKCEFGCIDSR